MELLSALQATVSFLDNDGRIALSGALYNASSQEWTWAQEYRAQDMQEAVTYHLDRWNDLANAADYISRLVVWERAA